MATVRVNGIRVKAYHGCMPEEAVVGGPFQVDIAVQCNLAKAAQSDELEDTVDYVQLTNIVEREMAIRSNLLEHVGQRIILAVKAEVAGADQVWVHIQKLEPPMKADLTSVSVEMEG